MGNELIHILLVEDVVHAYDLQVAGYFPKRTIGADFAPVIRLLNLYQASIQMPPDSYA